MIQLQMGRYTKKEALKLLEIFSAGVKSELYKKHCNETCQTCPNKRPCSDVGRAMVFLAEFINAR